MATEYDLSDYPVDGKNVLLAVVAPGWWRGAIFYDTYGADLGMAFCAEIDVDGKKTVTDDSWQTLWGGRVRAADLYHGEIYNAGFDSYEDISLITYDASEWKSPKVWKDQIITAFDVKNIPKHNTPISDLEIVPFTCPAVRIRKHLSKKPRTVTVYRGTRDNGSDFGEINVVAEFESKDSFIIKKG